MMQHEPEPAWMVRGLDRLPVLPGETLAGRWRIERVLGAGGMGIVLAARDTKTRERVAIKLLNPTSARAADVARFRLETEILASLESDQVARVHESGELDGIPYVVMEYFDGPTLAERLHQHGPMSIDATVDCLLDICRVLADVHAERIVHRDVKLENLLCVGDPDGASTKLIDFGIAKRLDAPPLEPPDSWVGSPRYMAPEQLQGDADLDHRADIWSVGIVAFELLTGEHPFAADTVCELRTVVLEDDALDLSELRADVPQALAAIVARCLSKRREDRFESADELSEALAAVKRRALAA